MAFFSKIFGKAERTATPLEKLLQTISPENAMRGYYLVEDPELRLPSAISMMVLRTTHRFCLGMFKMTKSMGDSTGLPSMNPPYDVMAFEAAAYCHYWLMRDCSTDSENCFGEADFQKDGVSDCAEDTREGDPYFHTLRVSTNLTNSLIVGYTNFNLHKHYFVRRVGSYLGLGQAGRTHREVAALFERKLISSIMKGAPASGSKESTLGNLPLGLAAKSYIPIYHQSHLIALAEAAKNLSEASKKGLLQ
jgi:hypothetical protein